VIDFCAGKTIKKEIKKKTANIGGTENLLKTTIII
jgi:hypothetical protein